MSKLTILNFNNAAVRTVEVNGEPWWVAKDVCDVIGIINAGQAAGRLDDDEKGVCKVDTLRGEQELVVVSEPGLYSLIGRSNKPEAKAFMRWVRHEVLPSIRKTGGYAVPGAAPSVAAELAPVMDMLAQNLLALTGKSEFVERIATEAADMAAEAKRDLILAQEKMAVMQAAIEDRDLDKRQTLRQSVESIKAQVFKEMTARGVSVGKVAHDFWAEVKGRADVASVKVENLTVSAAQRLYAESIRQAQIWGVSVDAPVPLSF